MLYTIVLVKWIRSEITSDSLNTYSDEVNRFALWNICNHNLANISYQKGTNTHITARQYKF